MGRPSCAHVGETRASRRLHPLRAKYWEGTLSDIHACSPTATHHNFLILWTEGHSLFRLGVDRSWPVCSLGSLLLLCMFASTCALEIGVERLTRCCSAVR